MISAFGKTRNYRTKFGANSFIISAKQIRRRNCEAQSNPLRKKNRKKRFVYEGRKKKKRARYRPSLSKKTKGKHVHAKERSIFTP